MWTFVSKVMSLLFNMLCRFVMAFLPRSKWLLISWLQSPSSVILEPKKIKSVTVSSPQPICHKVMGLDAMTLIFLMFTFKPAFHSLTFNKRLQFLLAFCHYGGVICISEVTGNSSVNLHSSLCFIQSIVSHDVLWVKVKQGENIQPWHTPFPILNQSVVPCLVLTVASWPACRFFRRQVKWSGTFISLRIFHSLLWSKKSKALM